MNNLRIAFILLFLFISPILKAQTVDSTFGVNGYLDYGPLGNSQNNEGAGNSTVIQSDGKIITAISKNDGNTHSDLNYWTYRFNDDGSPDAGFGTNGASGIFAGDQSKNMDVKVEPDGKIVVIGETEYCVLGVCGAPQFIMMRLNPDGSKDSTFGTNGELITTDIFDTAGLYALGQKVFLVSNGKYIIAGKGAFGRPFVARLNHDGSKDLSFGVDGIYSDTSYYAFMKDIVVDANENVYGVLLNYGVFDTLNLSDVSVFKIDNTGHLDTNFGNSGYKLINVSNRDVPTSIAQLSDGKIAITGFSRPSYSTGYGLEEFGFLILLNSDGTLSSNFPQGYLPFEVPTDSATFANKVVITDGDKIVLAGHSMIKNSTGNYELKAFIYCVDKYGNPVTSFNSTGLMIFDYGAHSSIGCLATFYDIDIQSNGDLFATGYRNPIAHNVAQSVFILKLMNSNLTLGENEISNEKSLEVKLFPNTSLNPTLEFEVPVSTPTTICLYSSTGQLVHTFLNNRILQKGKFSLQLNYPSDINSGTYFLSVQCANGSNSVQVVSISK